MAWDVPSTISLPFRFALFPIISVLIRWAFASLFLLLGTGCSTPLTWVHESAPNPSCFPNRLPTWKDYSPEDRPGNPSAETAVQFFLRTSPPRLQVRFDPRQSWVKPELADPQSPKLWRASQQLLVHEQLHFLISCLLTRQANLTLSQGSNPYAMLNLVKAVAQRMNLQYDKDTNHGLNLENQEQWQLAIQEQLQDIEANRKIGGI